VKRIQRQAISAGELEGVDEEPVREAHFEVVDKSHGEGNFLSCAGEARDVLGEQHAHGGGDDIVHSQCAERQGDRLRHVKPTEDRDSAEERPPPRVLEVGPRNARQPAHHIHQPPAPHVVLHRRPHSQTHPSPSPSQAPAREAPLALEFAIAKPQKRCGHEHHPRHVHTLLLFLLLTLLQAKPHAHRTHVTLPSNTHVHTPTNTIEKNICK
jgi:hypothetical protein